MINITCYRSVPCWTVQLLLLFTFSLVLTIRHKNFSIDAPIFSPVRQPVIQAFPYGKNLAVVHELLNPWWGFLLEDKFWWCCKPQADRFFHETHSASQLQVYAECLDVFLKLFQDHICSRYMWKFWDMWTQFRWFFFEMHFKHHASFWSPILRYFKMYVKFLLLFVKLYVEIVWFCWMNVCLLAMSFHSSQDFLSIFLSSVCCVGCHHIWCSALVFMGGLLIKACPVCTFAVHDVQCVHFCTCPVCTLLYMSSVYIAVDYRSAVRCIFCIAH